MTKDQIKALISAKIAGQGSAVDVGGALPTILNSIIDLIPESGGGDEPLEINLIPTYNGYFSADEIGLSQADFIKLVKGEIKALSTYEETYDIYRILLRRDAMGMGDSSIVYATATSIVMLSADTLAEPESFRYSCQTKTITEIPVTPTWDEIPMSSGTHDIDYFGITISSLRNILNGGVSKIKDSNNVIVSVLYADYDGSEFIYTNGEKFYDAVVNFDDEQISISVLDVRSAVQNEKRTLTVNSLPATGTFTAEQLANYDINDVALDDIKSGKIGSIQGGDGEPMLTILYAAQGTYGVDFIAGAVETGSFGQILSVFWTAADEATVKNTTI